METGNLMLYKLMILYILRKVDFPLTNAQISAFILDKGYTSYFNIQRSISDLIEEEFISMKIVRNSTLYEITELGSETLSLFSNLISSGIKDDIDNYLLENKYELRNEVSILANFYQVKKDKYSVNLKVTEHNTSIIELTLEIPTEDEAIKLCNNWKSKSTEIYSYLLSTLLEE